MPWNKETNKQTHIYIQRHKNTYIYVRNLWDMVANMLDCDIVGSKFKLQLCSCVQIQTNNTIGKIMNLLIPLQINSVTELTCFWEYSSFNTFLQLSG